MSEAQQIKEQCLMMAAAELEQLLKIIGELGYVGYKVSLCKLKGGSYNQCKLRFGVSRQKVLRHWKTCRQKGYDADLKRIFRI